MSKTYEYRDIEYSLHAVGADWYGMIHSIRLEVQTRRRTKRAAGEAIRDAIDLHLDYESNRSLALAVRSITGIVTLHADGILDLPLGVRPTTKQLCEIADKVLLLLKRNLEQDAQFEANEDKSELISKLQRMTTANGASEGEAANARAILEKLGATP